MSFYWFSLNGTPFKLEMCPEDMDAPASEMLEVGNLLVICTGKVPMSLPCRSLILSTPLTHTLKFHQIWPE